jgi:hypothetical protein
MPLTPILSRKGRGTLFFPPPLMGGDEGEGDIYQLTQTLQKKNVKNSYLEMHKSPQSPL